MKMKPIYFALLGLLAMGCPDRLLAESSYQKSFNSLYGVSGTKLGKCSVCHTKLPDVNSYGMDFAEKHEGSVTAAIKSIEHLDSDKDGYSNLDEIKVRSFPGNSASSPVKIADKEKNYHEAKSSQLPHVSSVGKQTDKASLGKKPGGRRACPRETPRRCEVP